MCLCKKKGKKGKKGCQKPEKLKGKPSECSKEQIEECHGSSSDHCCCEKDDDET